jgi:dipeptidyl aminopeptidase/acylaminoacyl peptidase
MTVELPFSIKNGSGDFIRGDLRYDEGIRRRPVVIVCHGFTAHKNWGPFPYFGRRLAELGFASIVFNFSHNGIDRSSFRFSEFEKFSRNTIGKELEDLRAIVDAIESGAVGREVVDRSRLGVVGHSRGGGVAIVSASRDQRIKAVAAWSTVATFFRYAKHQREEWEKQGYLPVTIRGSRTRLRYGIEVLRDLEANREAYDIRKAVQRLDASLLLVHGAADLSVKPSEAEDLYNVSDKSRSELVLLEKTGHMYGAKHPFKETNPTIEHVIELTARWFHLHI